MGLPSGPAPRIPSSFSCDRRCGKALPCGLHYCESVCHHGRCEPCDLDPLFSEKGRRCGCGRVSADEDERMRRSSCLDSLPSCGAVCSRLYLCGVHRCKRTCHEGRCNEDKEDFEKRLDSVATARLKARLEEDQLRGESSDKQSVSEEAVEEAKEKIAAAVGRHFVGCGGQQQIQCRCGAASVTVPCSVVEDLWLGKLEKERAAADDLSGEEEVFRCSVALRASGIGGREKTKEVLLVKGEPIPGSKREWEPKEEELRGVYYLCNSICGMKRACGRHRCSRRCCPHRREKGSERPYILCPLQCNKPLRCGNHHCELPCHSGFCPPCLQVSFQEVRRKAQARQQSWRRKQFQTSTWPANTFSVYSILMGSSEPF